MKQLLITVFLGLSLFNSMHANAAATVSNQRIDCQSSVECSNALQQIVALANKNQNLFDLIVDLKERGYQFDEIRISILRNGTLDGWYSLNGVKTFVFYNSNESSFIK